MKTHIYIVAFLAILSLAFSQPQKGNSCLFTCLNQVNPAKTVDQFITDFQKFTGTTQDGYTSGARATLQQTIDFIKSEFRTKDVKEVGLLPALDSGYKILTCLKLYDENGIPTYHEIVLTGYVPDEKYTKIKLKFYDPQTGHIESMKMMKYVRYNPPYALIIF